MELPTQDKLDRIAELGKLMNAEKSAEANQHATDLANAGKLEPVGPLQSSDIPAHLKDKQKILGAEPVKELDIERAKLVGDAIRVAKSAPDANADIKW